MPQYTYPIDTSGPALEPLDYDGLVTIYAVLNQFDSAVWHQKDRYNAWEDPALKALYREISDQEAQVREVLLRKHRDRLMLVSFRGFHNEEESHYDIQDAAQEAGFNEGVSYDSESGWFVVDTTESVADAFEAYLKEKWPALDFERELVDSADSDLADCHQRPPELGGWDRSKRWLADRGISIVITLPPLTPKPPQEVKRLVKEARDRLLETGLPFADACALLNPDGKL